MGDMGVRSDVKVAAAEYYREKGRPVRMRIDCNGLFVNA